MSQQGYLAWFSNSGGLPSLTQFLELFDLLGCDTVESVYQKPIVDSESDSDDCRFEPVCDKISVRTAFGLLDHTKVIWFDIENALLGDRIKKAVSREIPESIRGTFTPDRSFLMFGKDWWSDGSDPETRIPYQKMVGCWEYGMPNNTAATRELILALQEVVDTANGLEPLLGRIETAMYWHF